MSESVTLRAADGHIVQRLCRTSGGEPIAGLVVMQEIFGVNAHIRSVADGWARDGFLAVAPALFDRIQPGVELGYDPAGMQTAMSLFPKFDIDKAILDVAAAVDYAAGATHKKVGVIGYCLGGTIAWLSATRLQPAAAVGYYGGRIGNYAGENPPARSCSTSAARTRIFPPPKSRRSTPRTLKSKSSGMTPATPSTATRAPATTPQRQRSPPALPRIPQEASDLKPSEPGHQLSFPLPTSCSLFPASSPSQLHRHPAHDRPRRHVHAADLLVAGVAQFVSSQIRPQPSMHRASASRSTPGTPSADSARQSALRWSDTISCPSRPCPRRVNIFDRIIEHVLRLKPVQRGLRPVQRRPRDRAPSAISSEST